MKTERTDRTKKLTKLLTRTNITVYGNFSKQLPNVTIIRTPRWNPL